MVIKKDASGNVIVIRDDGTQTLYPNTDEGGDGAAMAALEELRAELGAAAYEDVTNNLTRVNAGAVLDARQGKVLKDLIDGIGGRFEIGTTDISRAAGTNTAEILFSKPFANLPVVFAVYSTGTPDRFRAYVVSRTVNGATIGLYNGGAAVDTAAPVSWLAIGR